MSVGLAIFVLLGVVAVIGIILVLRNYRRQSEFEEGPGKVPEDYS